MAAASNPGDDRDVPAVVPRAFTTMTGLEFFGRMRSETTNR